MAQERQKHEDEYWINHLGQWEASGKSRTRYCREAGISYWTFRERQKRFQEKSDQGKTLVQVPLKITGEPQDETRTIELLVNESIIIRIKSGFDGTLLRAVIQELGRIQ
jgi:hypothetical protein